MMAKIKSMRERAGFTQAEVAESLGIAQSTIAMWENGTNQPRADKLPQLAKLYGCKIDDLFDDTDRPA